MELHGVLTALITPFKNGEIDIPALKALVKRQLDAGVHGLVPLGSTGEAATISFEERETVIRVVLEEVAGRVPVVVGAGTNSTASTIDMVKQAKELGADYAMSVTPYYNKPTPEGMLAHYRAILEAVDIPLLAYNVPGRTGINVAPALAAQLAELPGLVGLKEASGNIMQVSEIASLTEGKLALFSGEDQLFYSILTLGGAGVICTCSNIQPERFVELYKRYTDGDLAGARKIQWELLPLIKLMFTFTNPVAVKAASTLLGLVGNELRLPLTPLDGAQLDSIRTGLNKIGLL